MTHAPFSSTHLPAVANAWTTMMRMDMEPRGTGAALRLQRRDLPGLSLAAFSGTPARIRRTAAQAATCGDDIIICVADHANVRTRNTRGDEAVYPPGGAHVWRANRPMTCEVDGRYRATLVALPSARVVAARPDLDRVLDAGSVRPRVHVHDLFVSYARAILRQPALPDTASASLIASHLAELALLAIGPPSADVLRASAPVRAARLRRLEEDIGATLADPRFSAEWIAARHGISSRYMRRLFAEKQTTFTDYVLHARLARARQMIERAPLDRTICAIAYECGFGDVSHFNRSFRRRYGITPSDVRAGRLRG